jgi:mannose-6-phosphate isomerase-like protein (cupin superfamily)
MHGLFTHIEQATLNNKNFRQVLYTAQGLQLVLMSIPAGGEIGLETHTENDQFFRFESGEGKVLIDGNEYLVKDGDAIIVPSGAQHNIINTSATQTLQLYTIYAPPHHKDGVVRATREEAETDGPEFDGQTTE